MRGIFALVLLVMLCSCEFSVPNADEKFGKQNFVSGIKGPSAEQLKHIEIKEKYLVGDKIGLFTLISQSDREIVAGGEDKHLDFKVSVLRVKESGAERVVLTTVVDVHNFFGKIYLFFIMPFHRLAVKTIMSNAVAANRV